MSHTGNVILQWTPNGVALYDPTVGRAETFGSVAEAAGRLGRGKSVIVALGRRVAFLRGVRLPDVEGDDLRQIVALRLADYFPTEGHEWAFDVLQSQDRNSEGRWTMVVALPSGELKSILDEVRQAGLKITRTIPVALGATMKGAVEDAIVVQSGIEGVSFDIVERGIVTRSRVAASDANLDQELARTRAMGAEHSVVLAESTLNLSAGTPLSAGDLESLSLGTTHINLLPSEVIAAGKRQISENRRRQAVLLSLAAVAIVAYVYSDYNKQAAEVDAVRARMNASLNKLRKEKEALETEVNKLNKTNVALEQAFSPAQTASDAVTVVSSVAPEGVWLTGLTFERGKPVQIRGTAKDETLVGKYLAGLSGQRRFRDVKLLFANNGEIETTPVVQFSLTAFPIGNLPIVQTKGKTKR